jgi:hypothetical protein
MEDAPSFFVVVSLDPPSSPSCWYRQASSTNIPATQREERLREREGEVDISETVFLNF